MASNVETYRALESQPLPKFRLSKSTSADALFFIMIVGGQSYFFGFFNPEWVYIPGFFDFRMLSILYSAFLTFLLFRQRRVLAFYPGGKIILLVAGYVFIQFMVSTVQFGMFNAFKVFRYYCLPLFAVGPLIYILTVSRERQLRLIRWAFIATVLQGFLFILYCYGFPVFFTPTIQPQPGHFGNLEDMRFNEGFPLYTTLIINASLLLLIYKHRLVYILCFIILSIATMLYATRSVIIPAFFSIMMIFMMLMFKRSRKIVGAIIIASLIVILGYMLFITLFPNYPEFIISRFMELSGPKGLRGAPNYKLRISYVENVIADMSSLKSLLFGHGYMAALTRDLWFIGTKTTDIAMQNDAPIAGLLFTEGFVGVILRALPFIILFFAHIRLFLLSKNASDIIISILIITMILSDIIGWLQTSILRDLPLSLLPCCILHNLHSLSLAAFSKYKLDVHNT